MSRRDGYSKSQPQKMSIGLALRAIGGPTKGEHNRRIRVEQVRLAYFMQLWETLPDTVLKGAAPMYYQRGSVIVHVRTPMWAQEFSFMSDGIVRSAQATIPLADIRRVVWRVGRFPEGYVSRTRPRPPSSVQPWPPEKLPRQVIASLDEIEDPELRAAARDAACWVHAREQKREIERRQNHGKSER